MDNGDEEDFCLGGECAYPATSGGQKEEPVGTGSSSEERPSSKSATRTTLEEQHTQRQQPSSSPGHPSSSSRQPARHEGKTPSRHSTQWTVQRVPVPPVAAFMKTPRRGGGADRSLSPSPRDPTEAEQKEIEEGQCRGEVVEVAAAFAHSNRSSHQHCSPSPTAHRKGASTHSLSSTGHSPPVATTSTSNTPPDRAYVYKKQIRELELQLVEAKYQNSVLRAYQESAERERDSLVAVVEAQEDAMERRELESTEERDRSQTASLESKQWEEILRCLLSVLASGSIRSGTGSGTPNSRRTKHIDDTNRRKRSCRSHNEVVPFDEFDDNAVELQGDDTDHQCATNNGASSSFLRFSDRRYDTDPEAVDGVPTAAVGRPKTSSTDGATGRLRAVVVPWAHHHHPQPQEEEEEQKVLLLQEEERKQQQQQGASTQQQQRRFRPAVGTRNVRMRNPIEQQKESECSCVVS